MSPFLPNDQSKRRSLVVTIPEGMGEEQIFETLLSEARSLHGEFELREDCNAGSVAAAIRSSSGKVYSGICAHLCCGIGTCAEHAAVMEMLKNRETQITELVAVGNEQRILSPCGRCRELLAQIDDRNLQCRIMLPHGEVKSLAGLLPSHWLIGREKQ